MSMHSFAKHKKFIRMATSVHHNDQRRPRRGAETPSRLLGLLSESQLAISPVSDIDHSIAVAIPRVARPLGDLAICVANDHEVGHFHNSIPVCVALQRRNDPML